MNSDIKPRELTLQTSHHLYGFWNHRVAAEIPHCCEVLAVQSRGLEVQIPALIQAGNSHTPTIHSSLKSGEREIVDACLMTASLPKKM